jgi:hypothetical protein
MPSVEENEEKFRGWGLAYVRAQHRVGGLPQHMMNDAARWIATQEERERRDQLDYEAEQRQLAREQKEIALRTEQIARATEQVARRTLLPAWVAAGAAIVAFIIGILAWLFPRA